MVQSLGLMAKAYLPLEGSHGSILGPPCLGSCPRPGQSGSARSVPRVVSLGAPRRRPGLALGSAGWRPGPTSLAGGLAWLGLASPTGPPKGDS